MKRFYKIVSLRHDVDGFGVSLDGKNIKTPVGKNLVVAQEEIAQLMADEWEAQEKEIKPDTMPVNQLVTSYIDGITPRPAIEDHILGYIDSDLLLYRSGTSPYQEKQAALWGKWTNWFESHFSVLLKISEEIALNQQDTRVTEIVQRFISTLDNFQIVLFDSVVEETSSYILAMAFYEGVATAEDLYQCFFLEDFIRAEIYDEEKYGAAPDQIKKREKILKNLQAIEKLITILRKV